MSAIILTKLNNYRLKSGLTQAELAKTSGVSRATISSIESGHCNPSVKIALQLASALGVSVEQLFGDLQQPNYERLAHRPRDNEDRYWCAEVFGQRVAFPVEMPLASWLPHDGLLSSSHIESSLVRTANQTLVIATCDPFVGLLRDELAKQGIRLLALQRTSRQSLKLLELGLVHIAGIHFGSEQSTTQNLDVATQLSKHSQYKLLRYATWNAGIACSESYNSFSLDRIINMDCRWINRPIGSSARASLDELLKARTSTEQINGYANEARSHQAVATVIQSGAADAGWVLEAVALSHGLGFQPIKNEFYDLCLPEKFEADHRYKALLSVVRSKSFRHVIQSISGLGTKYAGEIVDVSS